MSIPTYVISECFRITLLLYIKRDGQRNYL
nr:MAG TPA: hypothetical protein [Caudoviricetes sp.]